VTLRLHYWNTPNGHKPVILLEELGLPYEIVPVDIGRGEQFAPGFLAINPNNKIPALVDASGAGRAVTVAESGAILVYLAEREGRLLPAAGPARARVMQWLFWQVSGLGPMAGQAHHFVRYAPQPVPYAIERYLRETARLYRVLDGALANDEWIAGADLSIADIATYPWIVEHALQRQSLDDYPHVKRWFHAMAARPAVRAAYAMAERLFGDSRACFDARAARHLFAAEALPAA
jgi:GST-like protein